VAARRGPGALVWLSGRRIRYLVYDKFPDAEFADR
jgi:hypothetical protein